MPKNIKNNLLIPKILKDQVNVKHLESKKSSKNRKTYLVHCKNFWANGGSKRIRDIICADRKGEDKRKNKS